MKVNEQDKQSQTHSHRHELLRTLRGGTDAMREAGERYLPREPGEVPFKVEKAYRTQYVDPYENRLKRTTLFNAVDRTADSYRGKVFAKPLTVETSDQRLQEFASNVDGHGTTLAGLAAQAFDDLLWLGSGGFMVDTPQDGGRPFAVWYEAGSILGGRFENGEITLLRLKEVVSVSDGDWGQKEVERVRVYRKAEGVVEWAIFEENEKGEHITAGWNVFPLDVITFVPVLASGHKPGQLFDDSPLKDMADLNLRHWQEISDQTNIVHTARVPILFYKGATEDQNIEINVGVGYCITTEETNADLKYVEHNGQAISAGREAIKDLELQMQALGLEMLVNKPTAETATGRAIDAAATSSSLHNLVDSLSDALCKVLKHLALFRYITDAEVCINLNKDFGISGNHFEVIERAFDRGVIDDKTYLAEMERRGITSGSEL